MRMKDEVKNGIIVSVICIIIAFAWSYTGNNITNVYEEGVLRTFSTSIFALAMICLAIWSIQLFNHTGSLSANSVLREKDMKKRKLSEAKNRQNRGTFIYGFLFNLVIYVVTYIIISIS